MQDLECMQGDARDYINLALTEQRGADNRIYIARIRWAASNRHASVTLGAGAPDAKCGHPDAAGK